MVALPSMFQASRQSGERQRHRKVQRGAQGSRDDPAAEIRGEDLRLLGELDDCQHRDERRVLEECHEVVGHRRQRQAERLWSPHEPQDLRSLSPSVRAASS